MDVFRVAWGGREGGVGGLGVRGRVWFGMDGHPELKLPGLVPLGKETVFWYLSEAGWEDHSAVADDSTHPCSAPEYRKAG